MKGKRNNMRPKYPPIKSIEATGLADAYYKLVKTCLNEGAYKKRFYGKTVNTLDIVSLTEIKHPLLEPMLHPNFPTKELHLAEYERQWERDYDWKKQGFEYNYMDRLINYPIVELGYSVLEKDNKPYYHKSDSVTFIDQLSEISDKIANRIGKGGECLVSNRDEVITWIPDRDLFVNEDQPCMQRLQFFVYEYPFFEGSVEHPENNVYYNGKAEFHVTWRSRDLYSAWNSNMIGLIKMLMKEVFEPNHLELVRVVDFCNSLHIYEADWESAKNVKPVSINPQMMR